MLNMLRAAGMAAALALMPLAASAVTFNPSNNVANGDMIDITKDWSWNFQANFTKAADTKARTFTFTFRNTTALTRSMDFVGTVTQLSGSFSGGITFKFGDFTRTFAAGITSGFNTGLDYTNAAGKNWLSFLPGETKVLTVSFGRVTGAAANANTAISFDAITPSKFAVAPVPLPAAGGLLLAGLAGLGALRRRKAKA